MVRAPCCEKMGLKKGPWTTEEDQILVSHINIHGHGNWRALPKLAGLLRCGKSCRLRWINYLRPDIKRGNFSREEEDAIIDLHQMLGNRWSAIAARLPGRTDNEIKNVWHTHLKKKKRLIKQSTQDIIKMDMSRLSDHTTKDEQLIVNIKSETSDFTLSPPPQCSSDTSFATARSNITVDYNPEIAFSDSFFAMDRNFWFGVFPTGDSGIANNFDGFGSDSKAHENEDFWFNVFTRAGELQELQEMML